MVIKYNSHHWIQDAELKVLYTFSGPFMQSNCPNKCCVPHWLVAHVLFIQIHSHLELDSHKVYGIEYGYHFPRERAWKR